MTRNLWSPGRRAVLGTFAGLPLLHSLPAVAQAPRPGPASRTPDFAAGIEARMETWKRAGFVADARGVYRIMVGLTYRTDPERVRRMTPPFLDIDPDPLVQFNAYNSLVSGDKVSVITCGPDYTEIDLAFTCYYQGLRWWTSLPWILPRDFGRYRGRETQMLRKKDGDVFVDVDAAGVIRSHTVRRGFRMLELETAWLDEPAHPRYWFRETGNGDLRVDIHPDPDWRKGVIGDQKIHVSRHRGSEQGWALDFPKRSLDNAPRALDLKKTRFSVGEPSPYDAFSELPVVELVGGSVHLRPFDTNAVPVPRERGPGVERVAPYRANLGEVPAEQAAAFGFWGRAYDPPIFQGKAATPAGWPETGSMVNLANASLDRWRDRTALEAAAEHLLVVDFNPAAKQLSGVLPPMTQPAAKPVLRMIAASLGVNDLSPLSYTEVWLLLSARMDGEDVWYALSHLVAPGGDVITGRETWGWPTKMAEAVTISTEGDVLAIGVRRLHREVIDGRLRLNGGATGPSQKGFTVLGVQVPPTRIGSTAISMIETRMLTLPPSLRLPCMQKVGVVSWWIDTLSMFMRGFTAPPR